MGDDFSARDVGRDGRGVETPDIDQQGAEAGAANLLRDESMLGALGVEGAEDGDGGPQVSLTGCGPVNISMKLFYLVVVPFFG